MHLSRRLLVALLATAALAGSAVTAVTALADHGDDPGSRGLLWVSHLAPSVPSDPALHGVVPGALPWVLDRGEARLRGNGELRVRVEGLVIPVAPANGTPGPVRTVTASLFCGADTTPVGTTPAAPISTGGDARLEGTLDLPAKCLAPVVLVHPNGIAAAYIAASGFGGS